MKPNDLPALLPMPGSRWVASDGSPFGVEPDAPVYAVVDVHDGWVRFAMESPTEMPARSCSIETFQRVYVPAPAGHPRKRAPQQEVEAALRDMLDAFHIYAYNETARHNAVVRAKRALGMVP